MDVNGYGDNNEEDGDDEDHEGSDCRAGDHGKISCGMLGASRQLRIAFSLDNKQTNLTRQEETEMDGDNDRKARFMGYM